jgi:hypothetical protein
MFYNTIVSKSLALCIAHMIITNKIVLELNVVFNRRNHNTTQKNFIPKLCVKTFIMHKKLYLCLGFKRKEHLRDLSVDAMIILKLILKCRISEEGGAAFITLRTETRHRRPVNSFNIQGLPYKAGSSFTTD